MNRTVKQDLKAVCQPDASFENTVGFNFKLC